MYPLKINLFSGFRTVIFKRTFSKTTSVHFKPILRIQSNTIWNNQPKNPVKIDKGTVNLLEKLSLVDCANENNLKLIETAVNFASAIESVDTEGVEPLITVAEDRPLELREDAVIEVVPREEILRNAAITEEDYFVVPPGNVALE